TWQGRNFTEDAEATEKPKKIKVNEVRHDMGFFWKATIETYEELTGVDVNKLPDVKTPFPAETLDDFGLGTEREKHLDDKIEHQYAAMGAAAKRLPFTESEKVFQLTLDALKKVVYMTPADGDVLSRKPKAMAHVSVPATEAQPRKPCPLGLRRAKAKPKKKVKKAERPLSEDEILEKLAEDDPKLEGEQPGRLQPIAARVLMKLLYGARMARYDLLRAIAYLATCVTKWTEQCDKDLHHLMLYVKSTQDLQMVNWCGDDMKDCKLVMYTDADFAGCTRTQRSTSGIVIMLIGPNTKMMLSAISKRQSAVSHCTTEAEMIATALGLRAEAIPFQILWDILRRTNQPSGAPRSTTDDMDTPLPPIALDIMEDNQSMIKICHNQNWQKLRHLSRTHRVNGAFINECIHEPHHAIKLVGCKTDDMAADIGTKRFTDARKWHKLLYLNNIVDTKKFWKATSLTTYLNQVTPSNSFACPVTPITEVYAKAKALRTGTVPKWRYITNNDEDLDDSRFPVVCPAQKKNAARISPKTQAIRKVRRKYNIHTTQGYIEEQLKRRENESIDVPPEFANDLLALLHNIEWPDDKRTEVTGDGTCLGLTNTREGPRLGLRTGKASDLILHIRSMLDMMERQHKWLRNFKWTSIQVSHNSVAKRHKNTNNKGLSLAIGLGDYQGGEMKVEDTEYDIRNKILLTDGSKPHSSNNFRGNRWSLILFTHTKWFDLPAHIQRALIQKQFRVPGESRRGKLAMIEPIYYRHSYKKPPLTIMEYCCSSNSQICRQSQSLDRQTIVIRKTQDEADMLRPMNVDKAMLEIQEAPYGSLLLWASIPCTGGSPLQYLNFAKWKREGA
ncbi:MAG: Ty1/Copia family ribonuclease HI, partial [Kiritimatiellae bacterium]|nr:Ty1/Copia family ribonuclease HI [Kiritimatiellia bacterium]